MNAIVNPTDKLDIWQEALTWCKQGKSCGLATVASTWGTAPNPAGSQLLFSLEGEFEGSVSGGCIEAAVISEGQAILKKASSESGARPKVVHYGVSNEDAWSFGLSCGGSIAVYIEALSEQKATVLQKAHHKRSDRHTFALIHDQEGDQLTLASEPAHMYETYPGQPDLWLKGTTCLVGTDDHYNLTVMHRPVLKLVIIGGVAIAQHLVCMARPLGWQLVIVDPRRGWASPHRFPTCPLEHVWPEDYLATHPLDETSALVALCHDPKIDDGALAAALVSPALYVGALGSRKTNLSRKERLCVFPGVPQQWDRLHAPIGLDIGARDSAEIAVAILGDIIATRRQSVASDPVFPKKEFTK